MGGKYCLILCWIILAAIHSSWRRRRLILWSTTSITHSTAPLFSYIIYSRSWTSYYWSCFNHGDTTRCHLNRDDTKMICRTSCRTIGVAYSCIDPGIHYRTSKLLSNCNTSKATSSFYLLFCHKVMRSLEKFNTTQQQQQL